MGGLHCEHGLHLAHQLAEEEERVRLLRRRVCGEQRPQRRHLLLLRALAALRVGGHGVRAKHVHDRGQQLVHALPVGRVAVGAGPEEEHLHHHVLHALVLKVLVHAVGVEALQVLANLLAQLPVLVRPRPRAVLVLGQRVVQQRVRGLLRTHARRKVSAGGSGRAAAAPTSVGSSVFSALIAAYCSRCDSTIAFQSVTGLSSGRRPKKTRQATERTRQRFKPPAPQAPAGGGERQRSPARGKAFNGLGKQGGATQLARSWGVEAEGIAPSAASAAGTRRLLPRRRPRHPAGGNREV